MDVNSCMEQVNSVLTHTIKEILDRMPDESLSLEEKAFLLKIIKNIAMAAELNDYAQADLLKGRNQQHNIPDRKANRKAQLDVLEQYKAELEATKPSGR